MECDSFLKEKKIVLSYWIQNWCWLIFQYQFQRSLWEVSITVFILALEHLWPLFRWEWVQNGISGDFVICIRFLAELLSSLFREVHFYAIYINSKLVQFKRYRSFHRIAYHSNGCWLWILSFLHRADYEFRTHCILCLEWLSMLCTELKLQVVLTLVDSLALVCMRFLAFPAFWAKPKRNMTGCQCNMPGSTAT